MNDDGAAKSLSAVLARPGVTRILSMLNGDGEQARLIGGAVRNSLMGLPVIDIDIATTALPDIVMARATACQIHAVPTGIEHGTVTLVIDGVPHEITTLREDIETDGRRAKVRFGRSFEADALRRDFTINALSVEPAGTIHDYVGGTADLKARRVRFIGDPDQRIREDYLRTLRFFRFSASYAEGNLDKVGLKAALRNRAGLRSLSRERVRAEFMKLLAAPHAAPVLAIMADTQILDDVLDGPHSIEKLDNLRRSEHEAGISSDPIRHLLALAIGDASDLQRIRKALRLTNREFARMETAVSSADAVSGINTGNDGRILLYRLGAESFRDVVLLHAARTGDDVTALLSLPERWQPPKFIPTGKNVIAQGVSRGPEVTRLLNAAEQCWLEAGMPAAATDQMRILQTTVERQLHDRTSG